MFKDRPKYKQLLKHQFIKKYEKEDVDVGAWYRDTQRRLNGSRGTEGSQKHRREDPLRSGDVLRGMYYVYCNYMLNLFIITHRIGFTYN